MEKARMKKLCLLSNKTIKSIIPIFLFHIISCSSIDGEVSELVSSMTLEEKIGQMTQVDYRYLADKSDIKKYFLGSILSGGGSTPPTNQPSSWVDLYNGFQEEALKTRLKIPLIYGIDAVHGHNNVLGATMFPHNIGLGCMNDKALVQDIAAATAEEVKATGLDWTFAPCVAVAQDERWGRTYESYSEDSDIVTELGVASTIGFQGRTLNKNSVLACAKDNPQWFHSFEDVKNPDDNPYIFHPNQQRTAFVTPRSLHMASDLIHERDNMGDNVLTAGLIGSIGERGALDLMAYVKLIDKMPSREEIANSPKTAKIPDSVSATVMVVFRSLGSMTKDFVTPFMEYLVRLDIEAQAMFVNGVRAKNYQHQSMVMTNAKFSAWAAQNNYMFGSDTK